MQISELQALLETYKTNYGDLRVVTPSFYNDDYDEKPQSYDLGEEYFQLAWENDFSKLTYIKNESEVNYINTVLAINV